MLSDDILQATAFIISSEHAVEYLCEFIQLIHKYILQLILFIKCILNEAQFLFFETGNLQRCMLFI